MDSDNMAILCSACLLGLTCRYDGKSKPNEKIIKLLKKETVIPVCPEQLGGLPTPREPSEQTGSKVITKSGRDVTSNYKRGAKEVLIIAKLYQVKKAILKQRSPSCGSGHIYDGTFTGTVTKGDGITTRLLKKNGIKVVADED
jgi:uncharacterized protein YbbK (DUF523 family)